MRKSGRDPKLNRTSSAASARWLSFIGFVSVLACVSVAARRFVPRAPSAKGPASTASPPSAPTGAGPALADRVEVRSPERLAFSGRVQTAILREGGARVTGNVVDASGGTIAGAEILASDARDQPLSLTTTDAAGKFSLDVLSGELRIVAQAEGYSRQLRTIQAPLAALKFVLTPAAMLVGRVLAEGTLAPLASMHVRATSADGANRVEREALTGADGSFRIDALETGRYSLLASSDRYRSDEQLVSLAPAQVSENIELHARGATQLRSVVHVAGSACEHGVVSVEGPIEASATLDAQGGAVIDGLPPGNYDVLAHCEGARDAHDRLELGSVPLTRDFQLERGLSVSGVVLTAAGAPVAGAQLNTVPLGEPPGRDTVACISDLQGEFSCSGLGPGEYDLELVPNEPTRAAAVRVLASTSGSPRVVIRTRAEGSVRVRIEAADSFDLQAMVLLAKPESGDTLSATTQGDSFIFNQLPLGRYEISSESEPSSSVRAELTREGQTLELQLRLPPPRRIEGRVVDDAGQGVPDVWVRASSESDYVPTSAVTPILSDASGAFALAGLVRGRYTISATGSGGDARLEGVESESRNVLVPWRAAVGSAQLP